MLFHLDSSLKTDLSSVKMGSCDKKIVIGILFAILNFVLFLTGFGLIGIGAYSQYYLNTFALFLNSPYIIMVPIILMISGILIVVVTPTVCCCEVFYAGLVLTFITLMLLPTFIITMTYKVSILYCDESMVFLIFEHF